MLVLYTLVSNAYIRCTLLIKCMCVCSAGPGSSSSVRERVVTLSTEVSDRKRGQRMDKVKLYCSNEVSAPMVFSFHSLIV